MLYTTATEKGRRKNNQDFAQAFSNQKGYLAAFLCDGLGGHQGGDVASMMAVSQLGNHWEKSFYENAEESGFIQWIQKIVNQENQRILQTAEQYKDLRGMGTTIVGAFFMEDQVLLINVGDSRAYRYDGKELLQLTKDHSLVEELESTGEITRDEAEKFVNQHMLTRSLGADEEIVVDFYYLDYGLFKYVMLCSDGLSNFVSVKEMKEILADSITNEEKTQKLIYRALENEGTDNITVSLIEQEGKSDDQSTH